MSRIPVTVLTGFLGAGKTTLLREILTEKHGHRIAVIINEMAEESIDAGLVDFASEEILETNNGCICCSVRTDLIRMLIELLTRRSKFDRVLIETTGMADPGPVIQTFFMEPEIAENYELDGLVTLVDAKHFLMHVGDEGGEALRQVAFADVILLNKTDIATPQEIAATEREIHRLNPVVRIVRTAHSKAPLDQILNLGGFDLQRLAKNGLEEEEPEHHHHHEHGGCCGHGPGECGHDHDHDHNECDHEHGECCHDHDHEHHDHEEPAHGLHSHHTPSVRSISLTTATPVDPKKLDLWLGILLKERGLDLYRMKGIVNIAGMDRRLVFQGVHMLFGAGLDREWRKDEKRTSRLVFIGKNLDEAELKAGLKACEKK